MTESGTMPSGKEWRPGLGEARTYFGKPEIVAELNGLSEQGYGDLRKSFWPLHRNVGEERFRALMRQLEDDQIRDLTEGSLIADAYNSPWSNNSPRVIVPSDMWPALRRDFDNSGATGDGIKLIQLRLWRANSFGIPAISPLPTRMTLVLELQTRTVHLDGRIGTLSQRPFQLLHLLARRLRAGRPTVTNDEIYDELFSAKVDPNAVRDVARQLRTQLKEKFPDVSFDRDILIEVHLGRGYSLKLAPDAVRIEESNSPTA